MQHEDFCNRAAHKDPLDETQARTPCVGSPEAQIPGTRTEAWLTQDEQGATVVDIAHDPRASIPVQAAARFGQQLVDMAVRGGAVPDPA